MQVRIQAKFSKEGNIKIGRMWSFSKLYGNHSISIPKMGVDMVGSCGGYCGSCEYGGCYVAKSYRYPSVIYSHGRNTAAFRADLDNAFSDLFGQLNRAKKPPETVRINQSGEIESFAEFASWGLLARQFPHINFYIYTKALDHAAAALEAGLIPDNMTVLVSVWHEYGLAEYARLAKYDNVKAFVYDDFTFDYSAHGLQIGTSCHAYSDNGKLNHAVTCDKCRKCFNRNKASKVIRCAAH